ncbi:MAG: biopolymer transporter ExbD [Muribaculaceae bacterium]|nr:biopolymer transporter ExbD [Muribaculaceae bacterium]
MGKVKIKKKSTLIDMTAMSDVTVLLLTFFMLTSTFLKKEPTVVYTPSSVSEEMIPSSDLVTVLVSSVDKSGRLDDPTSVEGKIFLSFAGDSVISSEALRSMVLTEALSIYNKKHPKNPIELNQKEVNTFARSNMMGVPFRDLKQVLDMDPAKMDQYMTQLGDPGVGIPINGNKDKNGNLNDFQIWMSALSNIASDKRKEKIEELGLDETNADDRQKIRELDILYNALYQGRSITIKADKDTPFATINEVFDNLQTMGLNKFTLQTALKTESN